MRALLAVAFGALVSLPAAAQPPSPSPADTASAPRERPAPADTARRIVRRFPPIEVRSQLHDLSSSQTVQLVPSTSLRVLPIDRLADALTLKAGIVSRADELHVRGGRAGELRVLLEGVELNDPQRGAPMELPLTAVRSADVVTGGLDAGYGGALAGVVELRTFDPGASWGGEAQWQTDGALFTRYDRGAVRVGGPVGAGLGVVLSGDVALDGTPLPSLRTVGRQELWGMSLGWRNENRFLGHLKLAPVASPASWSLQVAASRRVHLPYDPMWSYDGYVGFCDECPEVFQVSDEPLPGFSPYRAADHNTLTDERRLASVLAWGRTRGNWRATSSLGFTALRSITSLDGRDDDSYLRDENAPVWGDYDGPGTDPFHAYWGDELLFRRAANEQWTLWGTLQRFFTSATARAGLGLTYDHVSLFSVDDPVPTMNAVDTLRRYDARAPGGFAFAETRWTRDRMVVNAGLRAQYFTAGASGRDAEGNPPPGVWSLNPRLGLVMPVSGRDVVSISYVRIEQNPLRDQLYDSRTKKMIAFDPLGNGALRPSSVISYQAAVKHLLSDRWSFQLAAFYRDLFDLIGTRNTGGAAYPGHRNYTNDDFGHAAGFETGASLDDGERLHAELHYTFMDAWGSASREEGVPIGPTLGHRVDPTAEHPLDWDFRHTIALSFYWQRPGAVSVSWSTLLQSGAPWTPSEPRDLTAQEGQLNSRRLLWTEQSSLAVRWQFPALPHLWFGVDARNVFDWQGDLLTTVDGRPNPRINTVYDDYGAYRTETGLDGGGFYEDLDNDGVPEWHPVGDLRLAAAPRAARVMMGVRW